MTAPQTITNPGGAPIGPVQGGTLLSGRENYKAVNARKQSWLEYVHPFYHDNVDRWAYARDYYTGNVVDPSRVAQYLIRRAAGETDPAYDERCKLADYTNHFAQVVESLAGRLFAVEGDANRRFMNDAGIGLGDPTDPATAIGRLWRRASPEGEGYLTVWKQLAIELCVSPMAWCMVDVVNGQPLIRVFPPSMVTNWIELPTGPEIVMIEAVDDRPSLSAPPVFGLQYIHMQPSGWQRYTIDVQGRENKVEGPSGAGTWRYTAPDGRPSLPIFRVQLPMRRNVGYLLARKAASIFNLESSRDNLLRVANHPRLVIAADDDHFDTITDELSQGGNAMQEVVGITSNGHRYIVPSSDPAKIATDVILEKIKDFHNTAHREYDDAAPAVRTATQVRQDVQSGEGAFLQLLKAGLDDAENNALWRIEQALKPNDKKYWYVSNVERSDNFMPNDPDAVLEKSVSLVFGAGKPVPVGRTAKLALVKEVATQRSLEYDEDQAEAAIAVSEIEMAIANATTNGIVVPDVVKVALFLCVLAASGLIDAEVAMDTLEGISDTLMQLVQTTPILAGAKPVADEEDEGMASGAPSDGGGDDTGVAIGSGGVAGNGITPDQSVIGATAPPLALGGATQIP
jgi:hypothetical protein